MYKFRVTSIRMAINIQLIPTEQFQPLSQTNLVNCTFYIDTAASFFPRERIYTILKIQVMPLPN